MKSNVIEINPSIRANNTRYFLNIYHDVALKETPQGITTDFSLGHFYVGLKDDNLIQAVGMYPKNPENLINKLVGPGIVRNEEARLKRAEIYAEVNNIEILTTKTIPLTAEQYYQANKFIEHSKRCEHTYIVGIRDCVDYVQSVYHSTGLSLYFTKIFTTNEIFQLKGEVAYKVFERYGSRDSFQQKFNMIKSSSAKDLSEELNIPIEQIVDFSWQTKLFAFDDTLTPAVSHFTVILKDNDNRIFNELEDISRPTAAFGAAGDASDIADTLRGLSLSDDQIKDAQQQAKNFFCNMMQGSKEPFTPPAFVMQENLFPEVNGDNQNWLNNILEESEKIIENLDINLTQTNFVSHNQNQGPNNYENSWGIYNDNGIPDFNNLMMQQMEIIGQTINGNLDNPNNGEENCVIC